MESHEEKLLAMVQESKMNQAREISKSATTYCETILKNTEETMARSIADVKNTRMNLRSAANRGQRRMK